MAVGALSACGARAKKRVNCLRDSASARELVCPGMWQIVMWKWLAAAEKKRVRSSAMMSGCLQRRFSQARMMAWSSQKKRILRPPQAWPRQPRWQTAPSNGWSMALGVVAWGGGTMLRESTPRNPVCRPRRCRAPCLRPRWLRGL